MIGGKDIIQLKSNFIPRGMIPIEKLFEQNDVAKDPKVQPTKNVVEDQNIGTEETPKIINCPKVRKFIAYTVTHILYDFIRYKLPALGLTAP